jgi:spermidine synthase
MAPAAAPASSPEPEEPAVGSGEAAVRRAARLAPRAAALVGFAFLLMELVWYRMLAPLLGGSSYTFGLILAVALLGIGAGGLLYGAGPLQQRPTLLAFAGTCALEAFCLALPLALGDRIAVLAALLRPLGGAGFAALVLAWAVITLLVVLPAALVAGYQFPLLIALLGSGRREVGREVGLTYAANTVGAILGSIAGGFGLIPLLSAPGVWRLVVILLLALAGVAVAAALGTGARARSAALPLAVGAAALLFCLAPGPSAFWRHSPIGAGRLSTANWQGPNDVRHALHDRRRGLAWERDGVESSVALADDREYAFLVNGKSDGSARTDAATQIMSGLVGALLHPHPRRALVIGLGTGSTAGWLAAVPSMERVDVVELEPAIVDVARACDPVNHQALSNPKVHLTIGDGRELLLTTDAHYDIIFSEPSNPYRAGVASLFSADFYRAARERLRPGGMFLQWLQGYELDAQVVRTVYATLASAFPSVESWEVNSGDLLLLATAEPVAHDVGRVRARALQEPFASALSRTWGVEGAEGFYAGYLAAPGFARAVQQAEGRWINTDDRPVLEFGFARNVGRSGLFHVDDLRRLARERGEGRPALIGGSGGSGGTLDWARVEELRGARDAFWDRSPADPPPGTPKDLEARILARQAYLGQAIGRACSWFLSQPEPPRSDLDVLLAAECLASRGDARALQFESRLRRRSPTEAELILTLYHAVTGNRVQANWHLTEALHAFRTDPWPYLPLAERILTVEVRRAAGDPATAAILFRDLGEPFAARLLDGGRLLLRLDLAGLIGRGDLCVEALAPFEPDVPWEESFLTSRLRCYERAGHRLAGRARRDLEDFLAAAPPNLEAGLPAAAAAP